MTLEKGERVHIIGRRRFPEDVRRHFVSEVTQCSELAFRARGYTWVFDTSVGQYVCRTELRERVIPFGDRLIINVIPHDSKLEDVRYVTHQEKGLLATENEHFFLEINEFSTMR